MAYHGKIVPGSTFVFPNDISDVVGKHVKYRRRCLNLIAAEQILSPTARRFLTCDLGHRYGTYYDDPSKRNYTGQKFIAELEMKTQNLAKDVFGAKYVDLRPLGGMLAAGSAILGLTKPGDTVFEADRYLGGMMTATKLSSIEHIDLNVEYFAVDAERHNVAVDASIAKMKDKVPRLLAFGLSHVLFPEPIDQFRAIASSNGTMISYDAAHVLGLIAGKRFPNPLAHGVDIMPSSTHKTFPGPQGGITLTNSYDVHLKVRKTLYPPLTSNHHLHRIPALAFSLLEMKEFGPAYAEQIMRNSKALGKALYDLGFEVLSADYGFTETHQLQIDVEKFGGVEKALETLEHANILVCRGRGKNLNSFDGIRIGTQEVTRVGMKESDMTGIAELFNRLLIDKEAAVTIAQDVGRFVASFDTLQYTFDRDASPYELIQ